MLRVACHRYHVGSNTFSRNIPALLVVTASLAQNLEGGERSMAWVDGGMFAQSLLLALYSLGLASVTLNWYEATPASDMAVRETLRINNAENIIVLIGTGHYPTEFRYPRSMRKPLSEVLVPERALVPSGFDLDAEPPWRYRSKKSRRGLSKMKKKTKKNK